MPVVDVVPVKSIQDVKEEIEEQKKSPIIVLSEEDDKYLFYDDKIPVTDKSRVYAEQELHTHCDKEAVSKRKKMKVVEFATIIHQGKTLKML